MCAVDMKVIVLTWLKCLIVLYNMSFTIRSQFFLFINLKPSVHIIAGIAIAQKEFSDQDDCMETVRSAIVAIFYFRSDRDHCDATIAERTVSIHSDR